MPNSEQSSLTFDSGFPIDAIARRGLTAGIL
jgi:hypothetical protein